MKAVLFDMDGTILDSEGFIVWTFREASKITGIPVDLDLVRRNIGRPIDDFREIVFRGVSDSEFELFMKVRARIASENWKRMIRVFEDALHALPALREKGFKLALASSSKEERIIEYLSYFGLLGYFDAISGVREGVRGKPYPDVIERALKELGLSPYQTVYVGDREVDCQAASAAGVPFILVDRNGYPYDEGSCKPSAVIRDLRSLLRVLNPF
ncbi:HAD family hydrolase [Thermogladius sp. 4427co]|uniref:HAD family hydrolase n=1 Tax=Thermogladius sp. 4427co TaxID=3450718 RepID=UPI003F78CFA3